MSALNQTLYGALVMGCFAVGLFLLRFWSTTRDRLFAMFAFAFWLLGLNWLGLAVLDTTQEQRTAFYALRAAAFVVILVAIVDKNRHARRVRPRPPTARRSGGRWRLHVASRRREQAGRPT